MCAMEPKYEAEALEWEVDKALELQAGAPEVLDIRITSREIVPPSQEARETEVRVATTVKIEAVVLDVIRSATGLQPEDTIHITFQTWEYGDGAAGGMIHNPSQPSAGTQVRGYLQATQDSANQAHTFGIAASILSLDSHWSKEDNSSGLLEHYQKMINDMRAY